MREPFYFEDMNLKLNGKTFSKRWNGQQQTLNFFIMKLLKQVKGKKERGEGGYFKAKMMV